MCHYAFTHVTNGHSETIFSITSKKTKNSRVLYRSHSFFFLKEAKLSCTFLGVIKFYSAIYESSFCFSCTWFIVVYRKKNAYRPKMKMSK